MGYLPIMILVLLLSGFFGGLINFFMSEEESKKALRCIVIGIGASFMVPLFLNMISSNLLEQIRGSESKPGDPLKYFVLAGFCLVASISSRAFIRTLSERIIREIKESGEKTKKEVLDNVKEEIAPILDKETENEPDEIKDLKSTIFTELSEDQITILRAMAERKYVLRSISGIAKETGIPRESVNKSINELISKGFVKQRDSEKGPRWFITFDGRKNLEAP